MYYREATRHDCCVFSSSNICSMLIPPEIGFEPNFLLNESFDVSLHDLIYMLIIRNRLQYFSSR